MPSNEAGHFARHPLSGGQHASTTLSAQYPNSFIQHVVPDSLSYHAVISLAPTSRITVPSHHVLLSHCYWACPMGTTWQCPAYVLSCTIQLSISDRRVYFQYFPCFLPLQSVVNPWLFPCLPNGQKPCAHHLVHIEICHALFSPWNEIAGGLPGALISRSVIYNSIHTTKHLLHVFFPVANAYSISLQLRSPPTPDFST